MRIFLCHFLYNFVKENINRARCPQRKTPSSLSRTFPTRREQGRVTAQDAFMRPALKRRLRDRRLSAGTPSAAPVKKGRPCRVAEGASVKVRKGIGKGFFIPGVRPGSTGEARRRPARCRNAGKYRGGGGNAGAGFDLPAKGRNAGARPGKGRRVPGSGRTHAGEAARTPRARPGAQPKRAECGPQGAEAPGMPGRPGGSPGG